MDRRGVIGTAGRGLRAAATAGVVTAALAGCVRDLSGDGRPGWAEDLDSRHRTAFSAAEPAGAVAAAPAPAAVLPASPSSEAQAAPIQPPVAAPETAREDGIAPASTAENAAEDQPGRLSFTVDTTAAPEEFAARLLDVAKRCWVQTDAAYAAKSPSPSVVALAYRGEAAPRAGTPLEALRLEAVAAGDASAAADVTAEGPLAVAAHRRVIERGLRQAAADLTACI